MKWSLLLKDVLQRARQESDRKQDRSRRTEQQILGAALRVFGRDGISRSRIADIAAEAGISTSTLYEYHTSKEDIAYAVPSAYLAKFYEEFAEAVVGKQRAKERISIYLSLIADFARRNPEWARLFYLEIWPSVLVGGTELSKSVDDFSRILIFLIKQAIEEGEWSDKLDPYETAALLIGSLNHVVITWLLYRRPKNLTKAGAGVVDRTLAMLDMESAALGVPMAKASQAG
ncbi:MAG: TetR/AcrR family transcriptional regulator [Pseudomonadota bacterium]